jgi:hypothetical protein
MPVAALAMTALYVREAIGLTRVASGVRTIGGIVLGTLVSRVHIADRATKQPTEALHAGLLPMPLRVLERANPSMRTSDPAG